MVFVQCYSYHAALSGQVALLDETVVEVEWFFTSVLLLYFYFEQRLHQTK